MTSTANIDATNAASTNTDAYHGEIPVRLPRSLIAELSELNQFKSLSAIAFEWFAICGAVWLSETFWNPLLYMLAVLCIGARLHALGVLMHDGSHRRILKNRQWNDIVSEVLLAWPLTITMYGYRHSHWAHHRKVNTEEDPDWIHDMQRAEFKFPKTKLNIARICILYLVGYYAIQEIKNASSYSVQTPRSLNAFRFFVYALVAGSAVYFSFWHLLLMYWIVPLLTSFMLLLYIRAVSEHHAGLTHDHVYGQSRTIYLSWWESLLFMPRNVNYHLDHHFYPSVPFYNLRKLHHHLLEDPAYRKEAHITDGIFRGLLREVQGQSRQPQFGEIA